MAQTYSQSITGINANARYNAPATIQVGDSDIAGNVNQKWAPDTAGALTARNNYILCKNPDGSQSYYRIDAERTIPGVSLVLIAV
jgi:hypothetical protein